MNYAKTLATVLDEAPPAKGLSRAELELKLSVINEDLKGPMNNAMRIILCGDRASLRKALTALPEATTA